MMLLLFGASSAQADCYVTEEDYQILRKELRDMRQDFGRPLLVAGDTPQCAKAIDAIAKNDPLLGIRLVPSEPGMANDTLGHALASSGQRCGAVLAPSSGSDWSGSQWELLPIGVCETPPDTDRRVVSLGYWQPVGVSARWNEQISPGFALLIDGAMQVPTTSITDPALQSWRVLGGFDISNDSLRGNFIGLRGGVERKLAERKAPPDTMDSSVVAQGVLGRRWIWDNDVALQLGLGGVVLVPEGNYTPGRAMSAGPLFEVRLGLAR